MSIGHDYIRGETPTRSSIDAGGKRAPKALAREGKRKAANRGTAAKRRNIAKDANLQLTVALATFRHNGKPSFRSARDVGKELGLSAQAVTALQQEGFERGLFTAPYVQVPQEHADVVQLETAVKRYYDLQHVMLVPGLPDMLDTLDETRRRSVQTQVIRAMAQRLAAYLDEMVAEAARTREAAQKAGQDLRPFVLGVAWGRTMHLIAEHLLSTPRPVSLPSLEVVPIVGITTVLNPEPIEANVIAMDIARAYRGVSAQLPCPAFVPSIAAGVTAQPEAVQTMLKKIAACQAVITGMGPIPENPYGAADITLSNDPIMNEQLFKAANTNGAIGEMCYWLFNRDGAAVQSTHTAIGLGYDGLRTIAKDSKRQVILVTGGDRRRFEPLQVALCARLASVLVSDTVTARALLAPSRCETA
jgi:DNA-binding transcriptional regulator LsrR (DeoR family)